MAAERLYLSGSYKQCHQLLSSKLEKDKNSQQTLPFRDTLILMNNKLTCELKFEQSVDSLERITEQFYMLWQLIIGLPESCDYHTTQSLMVACNVLSCFIRLWLKTGQSRHVNKSMEFIKQMKISEDSADCYMRRLLLLRKLLELITNTGTADFVSFLGDKRDYFQTGTQSDIEYEKVHQFYVDSQYSQCIDVIHKSKVCDAFTGDSQTLLLANCYARNGLYQLSLHYYYQCLRSKSASILIHKLAATNACTVYQIINNADAEMRMRQLLLELLKEEDNNAQHSSKDLLLVWRHRDRLETNRRMIGKDCIICL
ncbi:PREDICTED: uncharacterized protein LOC109583411 [Amphimedon queenslandica]|uniref:Uncharacterized protein n=1 Tax=Amphimedon queenslandica TaxID=400682 RepID=A0AAN0JC74_AMPQE|nr:PREDICTED: uncharacterized protein LOC109583411 [Amphimedon queenslandica]|eukprot:XP_019854298.1 PREDICTED: uncharacterized protein LOC109583411 [Amphimedon queenslandica]